jgi:ethanolamine utilization protein EutN
VFLADVLGTVVAPVKIPILEGQTLLLVRPIAPDGRKTGKVRIAIDRAQAGEGDRVLVVDEGNSARGIFGSTDGAVKTVVVGVVDYIDAPERLYDHREGREIAP